MSVYYMGDEQDLPGDVRLWIDLIDPGGQHRHIRTLARVTKFMKAEDHIGSLERIIKSVREITAD